MYIVYIYINNVQKIHNKTYINVQEISESELATGNFDLTSGTFHTLLFPLLSTSSRFMCLSCISKNILGILILKQNF